MALAPDPPGAAAAAPAAAPQKTLRGASGGVSNAAFQGQHARWDLGPHGCHIGEKGLLLGCGILWMVVLYGSWSWFSENDFCNC